jgi:uridine kinase
MKPSFTLLHQETYSLALTSKTTMLIIGITGGSGSGKTTVVNSLARRLPQGTVQVISQDSYYHDRGSLSDEEKLRYNFDHPCAIDFPLMVSHIKELMAGTPVEMPVYEYITCSRSDVTISVVPAKVLIVEGILIFTYKALRDLLNLKVFIDADPDERLMRIIRRDTRERGRNLQEVFNHYTRFVRPMHLQFIEPTMRYADLVIPGGAHNPATTDVIAAYIRDASG